MAKRLPSTLVWTVTVVADGVRTVSHWMGSPSDVARLAVLAEGVTQGVVSAASGGRRLAYRVESGQVFPARAPR